MSHPIQFLPVHLGPARISGLNPNAKSITNQLAMRDDGAPLPPFCSELRFRIWFSLKRYTFADEFPPEGAYGWIRPDSQSFSAISAENLRIGSDSGRIRLKSHWILKIFCGIGRKRVRIQPDPANPTNRPDSAWTQNTGRKYIGCDANPMGESYPHPWAITSQVWLAAGQAPGGLKYMKGLG